MRRRYVLTALTAVLMGVPTVFSQGVGGYGGPSMLSRGGNRPGHRGRAPMDLTFYGAIRATAESGLTPVQLDEEGQVLSQTRYGGQAELGVYGAHNWRRTSIGLDYRGDYRRTSPSTGYNGTNQAISLDLSHNLSRRTNLYFRELGGTSTRAFGGFAAPSIVDPGSLNLVNNELFDSRSYFNQTSIGASYRATARTTYAVTGEGFFVKRPDRRLIGISGYTGGTSMHYRITGRSTVGVQYQYMRFRYPRIYGGSDGHGGVGIFRRELTRNLMLTTTAGFMRLISTGTQRVTLSPEVAAILGRPTGVAAFERLSWIPQMSATLAYSLERSRFTGGYFTGVGAGNGVYLTTQVHSIHGGYSFTGIRKLSLGLSARASRSASRSIEIGPLTTYSGGGGASYVLTRLVSLSSQMDYRNFGTTSGLRGREGFFLAIGLSFSPTPFPTSIW